MKTILISNVSQVTLSHRMVTMPNFLALDAGGTATRAVLLNTSGECLGYGMAGGGNPVSRGFESALAALNLAAKRAVAGSKAPVGHVLVATAGMSLEPPLKLLRDSLTMLDPSTQLMMESDLLATFYSGTFHDFGHVLIAGTGAVGARVAQSQLLSVIDGAGWLLGDTGSGFWLGREVAQAVGAALDGRGPLTALTPLLLAELGIELHPMDRIQGRLRAQQQLIAKVYGQSPIELSRFAPLVFAAPLDSVAQDIVSRAATALAHTLLTAGLAAGTDAAKGNTQSGAPLTAGPLIFGGSVLTKGPLIATAVTQQLSAASGAPATPILVEDGAVGASVMVLKRSGVDVDAQIFNRIQSSLANLRRPH